MLDIFGGFAPPPPNQKPNGPPLTRLETLATQARCGSAPVTPVFSVVYWKISQTHLHKTRQKNLFLLSNNFLKGVSLIH